MADVATLSVEVREIFGKRNNRRMRSVGKIPAVLYGHNKTGVNLALRSDQVYAAIRHGNRFVSLTGDLNEKALIKECQWDTWGKQVLHIDFARVGEHEKIHMTVPVELRGDAPGTHEGGVVKQMLHSLEIECEASAVPDKIEVSINQLGFNKVLHVADLVLPKGVVALSESAAVVVTCQAAVEVEEADATQGPIEPELIGRKKSEDADE